MYSVDVMILIFSWFGMALLLWVYVPRDKLRDAWSIFLFKQFVTCCGGLYVVQNRWVEYPVREFSYANRTSFAFEFFAYPTLCVLFNLHYPEGKGRVRGLLHYLLYTTGITVFEKILEVKTDLIAYTKWEWYWTFVTIMLTFYLTRHFYLWFRKRLSRGEAHVR